MAGNSFLVHTNPDEDDELLNEHVDDPGDPDGVIAAEKQRQWQEQHPHTQPAPPGELKPKRRWPVVLAAVVVLAAAIAGAYWLGTHHTTKPASTHKSQKLPNDGRGERMYPATTQTKHYDSTNYSLGFDYPSNWTLSDTTAKLTITSPAMPLMTAVGAKVNARVVVTIQNQQTSIAGFPAGGAVASLASDLVKYTQPSPVQRAQTYLSYLSYTQPNGLDAIYLTGDTGYQQGQAAPMSDIVLGNPLVSAGFEKCASSGCGNGTADSVTLQASSWKSSQAAKAITSLIASIVINAS